MPRNGETNRESGKETAKEKAAAAAAEHAKGALASEARGNGLNGDAAFDLDVLSDALHAVSIGDFSVRLPRHKAGVAGKIAEAFNQIVTANQRMARQLERVSQVVGRDGETRERVRL